MTISLGDGGFDLRRAVSCCDKCGSAGGQCGGELRTSFYAEACAPESFRVVAEKQMFTIGGIDPLRP